MTNSELDLANSKHDGAACGCPTGRCQGSENSGDRLAVARAGAAATDVSDPRAVERLEAGCGSADLIRQADLTRAELFDAPGRLARALLDRLRQDPSVRDGLLGGRPAAEVLGWRLGRMPWSELVLLAALALGDPAPGRRWLEALRAAGADQTLLPDRRVSRAPPPPRRPPMPRRGVGASGDGDGGPGGLRAPGG